MSANDDFKVIMTSLNYAPNNRAALECLQRISDLNSDMLRALKAVNSRMYGILVTQDHEMLVKLINRAEGRK